MKKKLSQLHPKKKWSKKPNKTSVAETKEEKVPSATLEEKDSGIEPKQEGATIETAVL